MDDGTSNSSRVSALEALKVRRQQAAAPLAPGSPSVSSSAAAGAAPPPPPETKMVRTIAWICSMCNQECVPVRTESRCLCGHRLKEHDKLGPQSDLCKCNAARCTCKNFFFVVAEGAWVLRCRCKHKHVEHDPATHACKKAGCSCAKFDSPWVCNCDHPWAVHQQLVVTKKVLTLEGMMAAASLQDTADLAAGAVPQDIMISQVKRGMD